MTQDYKYLLDYTVRCLERMKAHGIEPVPFPLGRICPEFYNAIIMPWTGHSFEEAWGPQGASLNEDHDG